MAKSYTIQHIAEWMNAELKLGGSTENIRYLLLDSRKVSHPSKTLFFAIAGEQHNGHDYLYDAYHKGVRSFVVSKKVDLPDDANILKVKNTLDALQVLAKTHREQYNLPVLAITGSNGKTIVKEWLYQLLADDQNIIRSPKSYNSQVGVPLSVWQLDESHELGIFEAGISLPLEMDKLENIIQPNIGVFTNIGNAHGENFLSQPEKIREKVKLFKNTDTLIYCRDYENIHKEIIRTQTEKRQLLTWGEHKDADLHINSIDKSGGASKITATYKGKELDLVILFMDNASIENAMHCWLTLLYMGIEQLAIKERMLRLSPVAMRLELKEGINNTTIINDSYNSDLESINIALDFLVQQKNQPKQSLILSDILQSSLPPKELYTYVADLVKEKNITRFIGVGPQLKKHSKLFDNYARFFETTDELLSHLTDLDLEAESILLKGARKFHFERISSALEQKIHDTVLEINLNNMVRNLNYYKSLIQPSTKLMVMVKAFSYGSGSHEIANLLQFHRVDYLAVAFPDEGVELRKAGISLPIMVMNPEIDSFDAMIKHRLEPEIYSFRTLAAFERAIKHSFNENNDPYPIHIKTDTGMHRLGFDEEQIPELIAKINANPKLKVQSVFSHLVATDNPDLEEFTRVQIKTFEGIYHQFEEGLDYEFITHIINSDGIINYPEAQLDMVRLGIGLYGLSSNPSAQKKLHPVTKLKTVISQIKQVKANESIGYNRNFIAENDMTIATLPIGYADGLSRSLSNKGIVWMKDTLCPIVGNVCMDMVMVDITNVDVNEGDEVEVFGDCITINEVAKLSGTIGYEVLTGISRRVKRVYLQE